MIQIRPVSDLRNKFPVKREVMRHFVQIVAGYRVVQVGSNAWRLVCGYDNECVLRRCRSVAGTTHRCGGFDPLAGASLRRSRIVLLFIMLSPLYFICTAIGRMHPLSVHGCEFLRKKIR